MTFVFIAFAFAGVAFVAVWCDRPHKWSWTGTHCWGCSPSRWSRWRPLSRRCAGEGAASGL